MLVKIVTLFLVFMIVMGAIQRALNPNRKIGRRDQTRLGRPRKCPDCGRFLIGSGTCSCKR